MVGAHGVAACMRPVLLDEGHERGSVDTPYLGIGPGALDGGVQLLGVACPELDEQPAGSGHDKDEGGLLHLGQPLGHRCHRSLHVDQAVGELAVAEGAGVDAAEDVDDIAVEQPDDPGLDRGLRHADAPGQGGVAGPAVEHQAVDQGTIDVVQLHHGGVIVGVGHIRLLTAASLIQEAQAVSPVRRIIRGQLITARIELLPQSLSCQHMYNSASKNLVNTHALAWRRKTP